MPSRAKKLFAATTTSSGRSDSASKTRSTSYERTPNQATPIAVTATHGATSTIRTCGDRSCTRHNPHVASTSVEPRVYRPPHCGSDPPRYWKPQVSGYATRAASATHALVPPAPPARSPTARTEERRVGKGRGGAGGTQWSPE